MWVCMCVCEGEVCLRVCVWICVCFCMRCVWDCEYVVVIMWLGWCVCECVCGC